MNPSEVACDIISRNYDDFYHCTEEIIFTVLAWRARILGHVSTPDFAHGFGMMFDFRCADNRDIFDEAWMKYVQGESSTFRMNDILTFSYAPEKPEYMHAYMDRECEPHAAGKYRTLYEVVQHERELWVRVNLPERVLHHCTIEKLHENAGILMGLLGCKRINEAMQDYIFTYVDPYFNGNESDLTTYLEFTHQVGAPANRQGRHLVRRGAMACRFPSPRNFDLARQEMWKRPLTKMEEKVLIQLDAMYGTCLVDAIPRDKYFDSRSLAVDF